MKREERNPRASFKACPRYDLASGLWVGLVLSLSLGGGLVLNAQESSSGVKPAVSARAGASVGAIDPSAVFLEVHQFSTAATRLAKEGKTQAAIQSLDKAESYLATIAQQRPEWQPNVVRYRRSLNAQFREKLQKELQAKNPFSQVTSKPDFIEGSVVDVSKANPVSSRPAPRVGFASGGTKTEYEKELEDRLRGLLVELNDTRKKASSLETQLQSSSLQNKADERRLAQLQAELLQWQSQSGLTQSDREKALEKELAELKKRSQGTSSQREKELEEQLAQAQAQARQSQATHVEALQRQIASLTKVAKEKTEKELNLERDLRDLRLQMHKERTARERALEKRLDETLGQLASATKRAEEAEKKLAQGGGAGYSGSYDELNQELLKSQMELRAVTKALRETRSKMEDAIAKTASAEAGEEAYKKQLKEVREQLAKDRSSGNKVVTNLNKQLTQLEKKVKESEKEKSQALASVAALKTRLTESEAQLADTQAQKEVLENERNQLTALLKEGDVLKTKEMLDENLALAKQLKESQEQLAFYKGSNAAQKSQITLMETELARVKQRMIELRDENTDYRKRVSQLNEKLRTADAEIEKVLAQPTADSKLLEENTLLKEAITKQLRVLANREQARELLIASYRRLKLEDPQMVDAIKLLNEGEDLALNEREKELLAQAPQRSLNPDAIFVAPGYNSPQQQAQAFAQLQMEVQALGTSASSAYTKGRYSAAEQLYQTLLDKHPGHYPAHINLGVIYLKQQKAELAQEVLQNAVDLDPEHPAGQFLLGVAYYRTGRDAAAQMALLAAVQSDPANARAFFYLGNIASSAGKLADAVKHYERALEIDSSLADVYYNLASTYFNAQKLKEAQKNYDLAIQAGALPDRDLEEKLRAAGVAPSPLAPKVPSAGAGAPVATGESPLVIEAAAAEAEEGEEKAKGQEKGVVTPVEKAPDIIPAAPV